MCTAMKSPMTKLHSAHSGASLLNPHCEISLTTSLYHYQQLCPQIRDHSLTVQESAMCLLVALDGTVKRRRKLNPNGSLLLLLGNLELTSILASTIADLVPNQAVLFNKHLPKLFLPLLVSLGMSVPLVTCWKATKMAFNLQEPLVEAKSEQVKWGVPLPPCPALMCMQDSSINFSSLSSH